MIVIIIIGMIYTGWLVLANFYGLASALIIGNRPVNWLAVLFMGQNLAVFTMFVFMLLEMKWAVIYSWVVLIFWATIMGFIMSIVGMLSFGVSFSFFITGMIAYYIMLIPVSSKWGKAVSGREIKKAGS